MKAHDITAFTASKAFYSGVSVDQIMQACHWEAHNTFTNFYLKDLTWSDDNNMYLGPVRTSSSGTLSPRPFPSAYSSLGRGEGGGGSLQESIPGSRYWLPLQMFTVRYLMF